ncbi:hypothetical protein [Actinomadura flavalba]|uniref:hypothetical protein n=1 Tax=Actinomadura flavalba TaxID=1120938 RepID=UPI000368A323|nr:hypothetical protein [Actinomadura flavalba]
MSQPEEEKPLADRRRHPETQVEGDEDLGDEFTTGPSDPPNADQESATGGEAEGYSSQTEIP